MSGRDSYGGQREMLLAELAESYYLRGWTQQKVADTYGLTRPTVSRMLKEAQESGVVEIRIRKSSRVDKGQATRLAERYGLAGADVLVPNDGDELAALGAVGARVLRSLAFDGMFIGLTWGATLSAVVDAIDGWSLPHSTVIQLAGSLGASAGQFDSSAITQSLASALSARALLLSAPLLLDDEKMVHGLLTNRSNLLTYEQSRRCNIVLAGIGSAESEYSALRLGGHLAEEELGSLRAEGAVGDVCGHMISAEGFPVGEAFSRRQVNLPRTDLLKVPIRLAVAAGKHKTAAIRGALLGGYVTHLVTTSEVATDLLEPEAG